MKLLRILSLLCLALVTQPAHGAATLNQLLDAIADRDWPNAFSVAKEIDASDNKGDVLKAFTSSVKLSVEGKCDAAITLSRLVIQSAPGFLPAYEIYASCLVQQGRKSDAARLYQNLATALREGPEREIAQRRADALRPDFRPRISLDFGLMPSSNTSRRTSRTTTGNGGVLNAASRAKRGLSAFGKIKLTKPIFNTDRMLTQVSLSAGATVDSVTRLILPSLGTDLGHTLFLSPSTSVYAEPFYQHVWQSGEKFFSEFGSRFGASLKIDPSRYLKVELIGSRRNFADDNRDATFLYAIAKLARSLGSSDKLQYDVSVLHNNAANNFYTKTAASAGIEWEHLFENGFITSLSGRGGITLHDANAPFTTESRRDTYATGRIGISHKRFQFKNFRPEISYGYTRQFSNDLFHDYDAHDVGLRIKAEF